MTPETFQVEVNDVQYSVEGEVLPSGGTVFTFTPSLPGRTPVIHVPEDVVVDMMRTLAVDVDINHETGDVLLTLEMVEDVHPTEGEEGFQTAIETLPARSVLELVLEHVAHPCGHCGRFEFGNDVLPENVPELKKPFYLN